MNSYKNKYANRSLNTIFFKQFDLFFTFIELCIIYKINEARLCLHACMAFLF